MDAKRKAEIEREEKEMVSQSVLQLSWVGSCLIRWPYGTFPWSSKTRSHDPYLNKVCSLKQTGEEFKGRTFTVISIH